MRLLYFFAGLLAGCLIGYFSTSPQRSTASKDVTPLVIPVVEVASNNDREDSSTSIVASEVVTTRDDEFQELLGEVERRLRTIESDHAAAVKSSENTEELLKSVEQANQEFAIEARAAAEKNEEFIRVLQSYDPIWMGKTPEQFVAMTTKIFQDLSNENAQIRAELAEVNKKEIPE